VGPENDKEANVFKELQPVNFLSYNVHGLKSKLENTSFCRFISKYECVCLTETFVASYDDIDLSIFAEFDLYPAQATKLSNSGRLSGGILVMIKKSLKQYVSEIESDEKNVVVMRIDRKLFNMDLDLFWFCTYIPPKDSSFWTLREGPFGVELLEQFMLDMNSTYDFHCMISGDLNARTANNNCRIIDLDSDRASIKESPYARKAADCTTNMFGHQLINLCDMFEVVVLNGLQEFNFDDGYTFISDQGTSTVDYFLISSELLNTGTFIKSLAICNRNESDHLPITLSCRINIRQDAVSRHESMNEYLDKCVWQQANEDLYIFELNRDDVCLNLQRAMNLIDLDVDTALRDFSECIMHASECMKKKCFSVADTKSEWFDEECLFVKKWVRLKLIIFREQRSEKTLEHYLEAKKFYNALQKVKRLEFAKTKTDKLYEMINHPSKFWRELKVMGCGRSKLAMSSQIVIEEWLDHFRHILSDDNAHGIRENDMERDEWRENDAELLDVEFTEYEVKNEIMALSRGKACGLDGILPEMLKCGVDIVVPFLTKLFKKLFNDGIFPEQWSKAIIVPVFKKGNVHNVDNYRGISLLSVVSKCYAKLLNRRLCLWLHDRNIISECQAGFRKDYSPTDQIYNLYSIIQKTLTRKRRKLYVAFIDLRKAFDSVRHDILLDCLKKKGVSQKFFASIKAMYSSMLSCVRVNGELSDLFDCPVGVRQGCVLSPTLFSMFINYIAEQMASLGRHGVQILPGLMEIFILLFADDLALISTSPIGLQNQLNILHSCCEEMKMSVNIEKTKVMVFRKGGKLGKGECWYLANEKLEIVNRYCYLGFEFTPQLSVPIGVESLALKGKKALFCLLRVFWKYREMSQDLFFRIFDMKIKPILLYASEVWGLKRLESIERVHLMACKQFLGVPIMTPNKMVYGDLGRHPLFIYSYTNALKFWFKLLSMPNERMPKQNYKSLCLKDEIGKHNWVTDIRNILNQTGFGFVWLQQGVGNLCVFLKMFKERLLDMYKQEWSGALQISERHSNYCQIKAVLVTEKYLNQSANAYHRSTLSKLRFGMLPINNNLNRFSNRPESRMCPRCKNVQENELHFLKMCPLYEDLREKFTHSFINMPMRSILELKSLTVITMLPKFIIFALKKRKSFLKLKL
jgi:hypothetical protein